MTKKSITIAAIGFCAGMAIGVTIGCYNVHSTYLSRCKKLDWMNYNSKQDEFVFKDTVVTNAGELKYLTTGTTK